MKAYQYMNVWIEELDNLGWYYDKQYEGWRIVAAWPETQVQALTSLPKLGVRYIIEHETKAIPTDADGLPDL